MKQHFCFDTVIRGVLCQAEDDWIIEFQDLSVARFTFVIVCNGLVSAKPNMLHIPGQASFVEKGGTILHSSERRSDDLFRNKRVLVIGNGKSAVDAAAAAADVGSGAAIQVARRQMWYVPRYLLGFIQYKWAFHTRLGSALLPRYFETTALWLVVLHTLMASVKWILWRIVEVLLLLQYRLPYHLWPRWNTVESAALETSVLITDEAHLRRLRKGEIDLRIDTVERLSAGKAHLTTGSVEEVDVIVMATGWQLSFDTFMCSHDIFAGLGFDKDTLDFCNDGLWLYRNMLPPGFKGMAFVGSNTLTFINIFTSYIQAYWLAQLLAGEREWPTEAHMKDTIQREKVFKRKYYKDCGMRGASIEAYMQHYHDLLFAEMKARQPFNCLIRPVANLVVPMVPSVMKGCLEPKQALDKAKAKQKQQQQQQEEEEHKKTHRVIPATTPDLSESNSSASIDLEKQLFDRMRRNNSSTPGLEMRADEATIARTSDEEAALMLQASMNNRIRTSLNAIRDDRPEGIEI